MKFLQNFVKTFLTIALGNGFVRAGSSRTLDHNLGIDNTLSSACLQMP